MDDDKVDDTRGWFFVATRTRNADGTTTSEIRGGGKPAMVLAIGFVLVAAYVVFLMLSNPSQWEAAGGFLFVVMTFIGAYVYSNERENQPRRMSVNDEE